MNASGTRERHKNRSNYTLYDSVGKSLRTVKVCFFPLRVEDIDFNMFRPNVWHAFHDDRNTGVRFNLGKLQSFLVVHIFGDFFASADKDMTNIWFLTGERQNTTDLERHTFERLNRSAALTTRAFSIDTSLESRSNALTRHFDKAKRACAQDFRF